MKQTAVEWLIGYINHLNENGYDFRPKYDENIVKQAKEMESKQAQEYAEFAIRCDRKDMKILNFDGYINLETFKSE
jgi:hypothetical protein